MTTQNEHLKMTNTAELVQADTALRSFRDAGYNFSDAVGESIDNSIQAGAKHVRLDWIVTEVPKGGSKKKTVPEIESFAIADDGTGIPQGILANTLTVGFSTRYGDRNGIGRYGVGYKLASISQVKRLEVYTRPNYLRAEEEKREDGTSTWTFHDENKEGRVFMTYLDMDKITTGQQKVYEAKEVESFPEEYAHLMVDEYGDPATGTLVVWRKLDRLNEHRAYAKNVNEKISQLSYWLRRTYRYYIDSGLKIYLHGDGPVSPYDPSFQIANPEAEALAPGHSMVGEVVEQGTIELDGHLVGWQVCLTPPVTRLKEGGGGEKGPDDINQFKKLNIPDNNGKLSFLRRNREISYTIVPKMLPGGVDKGGLDRYIGIEVSFPPVLDEYFQVRHIKRGAEPIDKLRERLRKELDKPVKAARKRIRALWAEAKKNEWAVKGEDPSGGRERPEDVADEAEDRMPGGQAGQTVTPDQETIALRSAAEDVGITDPKAQDKFIERARQKAVVALEFGWPGKGLLDIEHLNRTVLVRINRRHPLISDVYLPLREALASELADMDEYAVRDLLEKAKDAIDLLFFAYAKAENMHPNPEKAYMELREDWGKFAAVYLQKRDEVEVGG